MSARKISEKSLENLKIRQQPLGDVALSRKALAVKLPPELDEYVRSKPNKNRWLNEVIKAAVEAEQQSA